MMLMMGNIPKKNMKQIKERILLNYLVNLLTVITEGRKGVKRLRNFLQILKILKRL